MYSRPSSRATTTTTTEAVVVYWMEYKHELNAVVRITLGTHFNCHKLWSSTRLKLLGHYNPCNDLTCTLFSTAFLSLSHALYYTLTTITTSYNFHLSFTYTFILLNVYLDMTQWFTVIYKTAFLFYLIPLEILIITYGNT